VKDASNYILTELNTLLNGNITYSGSTVKYYALNQEPSDSENLFMSVSSSYAQGDEGSKDSWLIPYTVNIDIVNRVNSLSEKAVNEVSSLISSAIWPTKSTLGINASGEFSPIKVSITSRSLPESQFNGLWHIRKVLELEILIKQL